jgi:hypothetical protein
MFKKEKIENIENIETFKTNIKTNEQISFNNEHLLKEIKKIN